MLDSSGPVDLVNPAVLQLELLLVVLLLAGRIHFDDAAILLNSVGRFVVRDSVRRIALVNPLFRGMGHGGRQQEEADEHAFHWTSSIVSDAQ
jgi:hypothetical protein